MTGYYLKTIKNSTKQELFDTIRVLKQVANVKKTFNNKENAEVVCHALSNRVFFNTKKITKNILILACLLLGYDFKLYNKYYITFNITWDFNNYNPYREYVP